MQPRNHDRRRFYSVGSDLRLNPSDFEFVNKAQALVPSTVPGAYVLAGNHEYAIEGLGAPLRFGLPTLRAKPALVVGVDNKELLDIYGFRKPFVSLRAKNLLAEIDPDAFEFAECAAVDGAGGPVEPYWMMDVVRVVDRFDEKRSNVLWHSDLYPGVEEAADNPFLTRLNDVRFPTVREDEHAFYLLRYQTGFIFDEIIVDAWREAGLRGALFTPLQAPMPEERVDAGLFENQPFWSEQE